jgi:hypothetical protein
MILHLSGSVIHDTEASELEKKMLFTQEKIRK